VTDLPTTTAVAILVVYANTRCPLLSALLFTGAGGEVAEVARRAGVGLAALGALVIVAGFGAATLAAIVIGSAVVAACRRALAFFADISRLTLGGVVRRTGDTLVGRRITHAMRRVASDTIRARFTSDGRHPGLGRAFSAFRNAVTKAGTDLPIGTTRAGIGSTSDAPTGVSTSLYLTKVVTAVTALAVVVGGTVVLDTDSVVRSSPLAADPSSAGAASSGCPCPRVIAASDERESETKEGTEENARSDDA